MRLEFDRLAILVAEDNAYMRAALVAMLEAFGVQTIHQAADGESALQLFRDERPDIVLLDWEMPERDGIAVTRSIRDRASSPDPFTPVLMISAHAEKGRILAARDAGISDFLAKPVRPRQLYDKLLGLAVDQRPFLAMGDYFGPDRRNPASTRERPGARDPREADPADDAGGGGRMRIIPAKPKPKPKPKRGAGSGGADAIEVVANPARLARKALVMDSDLRAGRRAGDTTGRRRALERVRERHRDGLGDAVSTLARGCRRSGKPSRGMEAPAPVPLSGRA